MIHTDGTPTIANHGSERLVDAPRDRILIDGEEAQVTVISPDLPDEPCTHDCRACARAGFCLGLDAGVPSTGQEMRAFDTGAVRNVDNDQLDFEGFLSPLVLKAFAEYMHEHRFCADGSVRSSDNWQKGIPRDSYMKSGFRHFFDWWLEHRGHESREGLVKAICGLIFNAQGYLHELLKEQGE